MTMRMSIPTEHRVPAPSLPIRGTWRLLYLKVWQPDVVFMLVLIVAFGVWFIRSTRVHDIVLWSDVSVRAAMSYVLVGPFCAALAAWTTGQDARRRMEDQLASTPRPSTWRDLQILLSGAAIGLLGYGGVVTVILAWGTLQATWGRPYGLILLSGLPWVVLMSVIGSIIGALWSNRFVPMVALVATGALPFLFSPFPFPGHQVEVPGHFSLRTVLTDGQYWVSEWRAVRTMPSLAPNMLLGLGSVGVVASAFLLRQSRTRAVLMMSIVSVAVSFAAALAIALSAGTPLTYHPDLDPRPASTFQYECREGHVVEVCMHPAYAESLDDAVAVADLYYEPIVGLPGVPSTIYQVDLNDRDVNGATTFSLQNAGYEEFQISHQLQLELLPLSVYFPGDAQEGQVVIGEWLIQRVAGPGMLSQRMIDSRGQEMTDSHREELVVAVDRFAALTPEEQRAWLEANWDTLRAGELTLEDLP